MSLALQEQGAAERHLADILRKQVLAEIERIGDTDTVAERLHMGRAGVEALMWKREWPVDKALRVAEALGLIDQIAIEAILTRLMLKSGA